MSEKQSSKSITIKSKILSWVERNIIAITIISASITIIFLFVGYAINGRLRGGDFDHDYLGALGDFLGGFLGSIFGIITIYLVYKTYKSQKEELRLSRELIQKQNEELKDQKEELRLTRATQEKQNFESTFFYFLKSLISLRDNIENNTSDRATKKGIAFFESLKQDISNEIDEIERLAKNDTYEFLSKQEALDFREKFYNDKLTPDTYRNWDLNDKSKFQVLLATYSTYYKNKHLILHYFSALEIILNLIDNNFKSEYEKDRINYSEILNSQISQIELFHIYHFCLLSERFRNKINEFKILNRFSYMELINVANHTLFYSEVIPLEGKLSILD